MRLVALLGMLAAMAAWLPAPVLAQSAGDDQYVDPFQEVPEQPTGGDSQGENDQRPPETESGVPSGTTEGSVDTPEPSDTGAVVETPESSAQVEAGSTGLPRSGIPLGWIALLGLGLILGGATLRRAAALNRSV
jgi:hypothetical protein